MEKELIEEIEKRINHIETLGKGYGVNAKRIGELKWVLKTIQKAKEQQGGNVSKLETATDEEIDNFLKGKRLLCVKKKGKGIMNPYVSINAAEQVHDYYIGVAKDLAKGIREKLTK